MQALAKLDKLPGVKNLLEVAYGIDSFAAEEFAPMFTMVSISPKDLRTT